MEALKSDRILGRVLRITLARPQVMNAINGVMVRELEEAMTSAAEDLEVRAIIVTGEGANFSAGGDIAFMKRMNRADFLEYHRASVGVARAIALCPKPTVAAVRGACAGGAFGFALGCDYLLAANTAYFSAQFLRIGLVADMGTGYFLAHRMGAHKARKLLLDNRVVRADEAAALGICDEIYLDEVLNEEALRMARRLAELPPRAVRQTKWLMRTAEGSLTGYLDDELTAAAECLGGDEFIEGTTAFFEKRPPRFA